MSEVTQICLGLASLIFVFVVWRYTKKSSARNGWDAHQYGLPYNPAWGKDTCRGWERRADGLPRP